MYQQKHNSYQPPRQSYQPPQPEPQEPESEPQHNFLEVVDFCKQKGLPAEAVGRWVWVHFDEKPSNEIIQSLRDFGFHWSARRQAWAHDCGNKSYPSQGDPRQKYDCWPINAESREERKQNFYASDGRYAR